MNAGTWTLGACRALTLCPRQRSVLTVASGGLWLTVSGKGAPAADHVLRPGDTFVVQAGQKAVLERWDPREDVAFGWDAAASLPTAMQVETRDEWLRTVAQPWADLRCRLRAGRQAAWGAGLASARLAWGLLRFAWLRGRAWGSPVVACVSKNQH
ncbi:MAG: DUF2917 domain-containing protein [Comamonadaceae bacterium]|nr:MAG: DUF2917 domain-containing protein [Comamonadaceae bacterium]